MKNIEKNLWYYWFGYIRFII